MTVNGNSVSLPSGSDAWAAIDTGTTGVGAPADVLASIFSHIEGSEQGTGQLSSYYLYLSCGIWPLVFSCWGSVSLVPLQWLVALTQLKSLLLWSCISCDICHRNRYEIAII